MEKLGAQDRLNKVEIVEAGARVRAEKLYRDYLLNPRETEEQIHTMPITSLVIAAMDLRSEATVLTTTLAAKYGVLAGHLEDLIRVKTETKLTKAF